MTFNLALNMNHSTIPTAPGDGRSGTLRSLILLCCLVATPLLAQNSRGTYRIPYANGTSVFVSNDHTTHTPTNRLDLVGTGGSAPYRIVAAASGIIRAIVDTNTVNCTTNGCGAFNNYVWIEHDNGEWTKYSHFRTGTVTGDAGLAVGMYVCAGTYLGDEGDIGFAFGEHLHFEVAVPTNNATPFQVAGGFINGVNRIPRFCGIGVLQGGNTYVAAACPTPQMSQGVYRIPYADGTSVFTSRDHVTHSPVQNRLDLVGTGGNGGPYPVVAAADGIIRAIVDTNTVTCTTNGCGGFNNYVWIEHPNGEWTKYTHFQTGTVTGNAGLTVGQTVCRGTYLGDEDDVGAASGIHLHFEVAVPTDLANPFQPSGGFVNGFNRIPVFCDIPGNIMVAGQTYVAGPCTTDGCQPDILLPPDVVHGANVYMAGQEIDSDHNPFVITPCGSVNMTAGNRIVFRPGFRSRFRSYLSARIRDCNEMERSANCLPIVIGGR